MTDTPTTLDPREMARDLSHTGELSMVYRCTIAAALTAALEENAILRTEKHEDAEAIAAMKEAGMDRLVAEGQRCDAMTPQDDRSLPGRIMVWHSSPTLNHLGTWATTRHPDDAVAYVPESLEAPTAVLDETSPRAAIGEIGNQMHNLACEFQSNEGLAERLGGFACELWRAAQSASSEPIPTMTPQEAAKVSAEDRENIVDEIESIICETHEMDVRDIDYAENIVSWLERHHPAALRAISENSQ